MFKLKLAFIVILSVFPLCSCYSRSMVDDGKIINEGKEAPADSYVWDFGKVKEGGILTHEFTLRNESKRTMKIIEVHTSCGCTASKIKKKELAPAESTKIEVEFKSAGYSGLVTQFVYVNTDDPERQIIKFTIKAEVIK